MGEKFCKIKKTWENSSLTITNLDSVISDKESDTPKIEILEHVVIKEKRAKKQYKKFSCDHILTNKKTQDGKIEISYYCKVCDREFKTKQQRYYHQYCDRKEMPFKCSFLNCLKSFPTDSLKRDHETSHSVTNLFHCKTCGITYKRKSSLRKHEYFHTDNFKYSCAICPDKKFIDKVKYEIHLNIHQKLLPFSCQTCNKKFAAKSYLTKHEILHSDKTKYFCLTCGKKFKWLTSFQLHKSSSTCSDNKEFFKCSICQSKSFFTKRALERHEKIHSNTRYSCKLCESVQSNRKDNLMRHLRHIHSEIEADKISEYIEVNNEKRVEIVKEIEKKPMEIVEVIETPQIQAVMEPPVILAPTQEVIPVVNNRVNVICSIGNPNKLLCPLVDPVKSIDPINLVDPVISVDPAYPVNSVKIVSPEPIDPPKSPEVIVIDPLQNNDKEIQLPPKKKATRPKYNPILHYRKMLLLHDHDEDEIHHVGNEHENDHEDQTAKFSKTHWRKMTSQKFAGIFQ